jgi:hypothetical protein
MLDARFSLPVNLLIGERLIGFSPLEINSKMIFYLRLSCWSRDIIKAKGKSEKASGRNDLTIFFFRGER